MRILSAVLGLLLLIFIYISTAGNDLYTLKSENNEFSDVITWLKTLNDPLPISKTQIVLKNGNINLADASIFYSERDKGFATRQLASNQDNPLLTINWYDIQEKPIGIWQESWPVDAPLPVCRIDESSGNLVCVDLQNRIRIINSAGKVSHQFQIIDSYTFHSENNAYVDLNVGFLAVGLTESQLSPGSKSRFKSYTRVFTLDGTTRMHLDLPDWRIRSLNGSSNGQLIAVSLYRRASEGTSYQFRTLVLNLEGNILLDQPFNARKIIYNHDNTKIFLMDKNLGYMIDLRSNTVIAKTWVQDAGNIYLSAIFLSQNDFLVTQEGKASQELNRDRASWIYDNIRIVSIDNSGSKVNNLTLDNITLNKPAFWYDEKLEQLFIGHRQGWKFYKVNR